MELREDQIERYSRQIILPQLGGGRARKTPKCQYLSNRGRWPGLSLLFVFGICRSW